MVRSAWATQKLLETIFKTIKKKTKYISLQSPWTQYPVPNKQIILNNNNISELT